MTTRIDQAHVRPSLIEHRGPIQRGAAAPGPNGERPGVITKPLDPAGIVRAPAPAPPSARPDGPGDATHGAPLTPEGLEAAFGQTESAYDLNQDRMVDIDDMVQLILQMPSGGTPEPAPAETEPTIDGFAGVWGQSDPVYDLDANTVVDIDDMVQFVLNMTPAPAVPAAPTAPTPIDTDGVDGAAPATTVATKRPGEPSLVGAPPSPTVTGEPLTIEGLKAAWGQSDSPYDLDQNGTVDIDDLVHYILNGTPSPGDTGTMVEGTVAPTEPAAAPAPPAAEPDVKIAGRLARSMISRLRAAGSTETLPANLGDLLDKLELKPDQAKTVAERLGRAFPNGVGVNEVG